MRLVQVVVSAGVGVALLAGALLAAKPAASAKPRPPVLPSWAPKHPSKEFLRAAKTLKPVPEEAQPYLATYVPAWELFGSLSDRQIKTFFTRTQVVEPLAKMPARYRETVKKAFEGRQIGDKMVSHIREVTVTYKSFSPRQRAIFSSLVSGWREVRKGTTEEDLLVTLYRWGAKKDLSNVYIGFFIRGAHEVEFSVGATTPKGSLNSGDWVAQM